MTDKQLTESEIMKGLECHKEADIDNCCDCPYFCIDGCAYQLSEEALALINRKNAAIELLENESKRQATKAIKEFAERVKNYYSHLKEGSCGASIGFYIDQIAKEMGVE